MTYPGKNSVKTLDTDVHDVEPRFTQQKKNYIQNIGEY